MDANVQTIILPITALVLSGLTWTLFGYFSSWRKNHKDPNWGGFEAKKLRDDLILGLILGVGSVIYVIATEGDVSPIASAQGFILAIQGGFGVVAAVDKLIVGGILGK